MKKLLISAAIFLGLGLGTPAFADNEYMQWVEANSNLTCTTEYPVVWVGKRKLAEIAPQAHLGAFSNGVIYVLAEKQSDRKNRKPIVVHEVVHGCQRDSNVHQEKTVDACLASETQAHEMDNLYRRQHRLKGEMPSAAYILKKCLF